MGVFRRGLKELLKIYSYILGTVEWTKYGVREAPAAQHEECEEAQVNESRNCWWWIAAEIEYIYLYVYSTTVEMTTI